MGRSERSLPPIPLRGSRRQDVALLVCAAAATATVWVIGMAAACALLPAFSRALLLRRRSARLRGVTCFADGRLSLHDLSGDVSAATVVRARCCRMGIFLRLRDDAARERKVMVWADQFDDPDHFRILSAFLRSVHRPGGNDAGEAGSVWPPGWFPGNRG